MQFAAFWCIERDRRGWRPPVAIAEKIITFQMDKKSITKGEMKVRSRIRRAATPSRLVSGPDSWYTACRHIKEHNEANTKYLGKLDDKTRQGPNYQMRVYFLLLKQQNKGNRTVVTPIELNKFWTIECGFVGYNEGLTLSRNTCLKRIEG